MNRPIGPTNWWGAQSSVILNFGVQASGANVGNPQIVLPALEIDFSMFPNGGQMLFLALGPNTITLPANTTVVDIVMPQNNGVDVTLKGDVTDVGIPLHPQGLNRFCVKSGTTSIILDTASALSGVAIMAY